MKWMIGLCLLVAVSGCDKQKSNEQEERPPVRQEEVQNELSESYHKEVLPEVELLGQTVSLPQNFPQDIPIYQEGVIISALNRKGQTEVSMSTDDSRDAVLVFYANRLREQGWSLAKEQEENQIDRLLYQKGERFLMIQFIPATRGGMIKTTYYTEKKDKNE